MEDIVTRYNRQTSDSVLFITLDSCRYDTFDAAAIPALKGVAPLHKAQAPSYFTYGSHSAMFVGFTPGIANVQIPVLNPKFGKLFKLVGGGFPGKGVEAYELVGRNIIEGFRARGFRTVGTGAVGWFDPTTSTGCHLTESFDEFYYPGNSHSLCRQLDWLNLRLEARGPVFAFINIGETHVPYWHEGASWSIDDNPCQPFQTNDRARDCRERQLRCLQYIDSQLEPLIEAFSSSTILVCGDHGDCWGEDGLWEHGISHVATLTVPLAVRVRGKPLG